MATATSQGTLGALTSHTPGSIRESWAMISPLMLMLASGGLMLFCDRIILSQYSTFAMTAVASAGTVAAIFQYGAAAITGISEVFVGQHNGARDYERVGEPVWQMIWLSVALWIPFIPIAFYTAEFFVADPYDNMGVPYFKWIMCFSPLIPMMSGLSGFFIGIGRTSIVMWTSLLGNIINLILVVILVFGIEGWIPSMGTAGAAIATCISWALQTVALFYAFLTPENRIKYRTNKCGFNWQSFIECIKIGYPSSISHTIEISAWAFQMHMMSWMGQVHITVLAIGQSVLILFLFISEALSKGLGSIAANYMGAGNYDIIPKCFRSSVLVHMALLMVVAIPLVVYPSPLIDWFLEESLGSQQLYALEYYAVWALIGVWIYLLIDGVSWALSGVLTAAGDTLYPMYINAINSWVFGVFPIYLWMHYSEVTPSLPWFLIAFYGCMNSVMMYWRYRSDSWRQNRIRRK